MLLALTGTPGTGKSTVARILRKKGYRVIALNRVIRRRKLVSGFDRKRKSWIVDLKKVERYLRNFENKKKSEIVILDSHISHLLSVDFAIVLRCSPAELEKRLKAKRWAKEKIRENVEAEMIDLIAAEAEEKLGKKRVVEINTTGKPPEKIAEEVEKLVKKWREKFERA